MKINLFSIIGLATAVLTSCAEDMINDTATDYLNGSEKTPIEVSLLLDKSSSPVTRAVDNKFEAGDELIAYLRHVTWDGRSGERELVNADQSPRLVTFTATGGYAEWNGSDIRPIGLWKVDGSDVLTFPLGLNSTNTKQATGLTASPALYWDDFSSSSSADKDLRTSGHYLQSYYGYCYNGSPAYGQSGTHISTQLFEANGTLGWKVATDQNNGFKTSDLLWSYEQTPVEYAHVDNEGNKNHGTLILPYTHAMSKVTIEVVCADGFDADVDKNFGSAEVTLNQMNTVTSLTAPTATAAVGNTPADIKMQKGTPEGKKCSFSALIAPTLFKAGNDLATITGVDGNKYTIPLTDAVLTTATSPAYAWSTQLAAAKVGGTAATSVTAHATSGYTATDGGITKPGVNYLITVTIKKQKISVSATIKGWDKVTATGEGTIHFVNDITDKGTIANDLHANGFDVYLKGTEVAAVYGAKKSTVTWNSGTNEWTYSPIMYWPSGANSSYFRALSGATADNAETVDNESLIMKNGQDVLWATTPEHSAPKKENPDFKYKKGDPIAPRTGDVPLAFEHAMSKISVKLATTEGNDAVNLTGARISIANIYDRGKIDLEEGNISELAESNHDNPVPIKNFLDMKATAGEGDKLKDYVVVPQKLNVMADGTTERTGTVSFYNKNELYEIGGTYYVTTSLEPVYYTPDEIVHQNADLPGAISTNTEKVPAIRFATPEEVAAYNAQLTGAVKEGDKLNYTAEEFKALLNTEIPKDLYDYLFGDFYGFDYEEYISTTPAFNPFGENTGEDYLTISATDEYKNCKHNEVSAKAYNAKLSGAVELGTVIPAVYYDEEEVLTYNAKLPGALRPTDIKEYTTKDGSKTANPGDLKMPIETNPVIKMLILLEDGSTYTLDLANCKATDAEGNTTGDVVTEWKRGEHYTYTVILTKQKVTFRAMVKDWEEKKGSGNATLEWD